MDFDHKFILLLFSLQALYWWIGKRSSKGVNNQADYYLAGKNVPFFPLMMTFLATQVGGGLVLGASDEAYQFGWSVLLYPMGNALGLILLGLGVGRKLSQLPVSTIAQIFEVVYRSPFLRKIASTLSVVSLFMILVGQIVASRKFLIALGLSSPVLFIGFWSVIILYTVRGGLKAVISTDVAQALLFSGVFLFCLGITLFEGHIPSSSLDSFALSSSKLTGWLLMPWLFMVIEQDMGQRCFAGDSPRTVSLAAFWAGILALIVCVVPIFFGVLAKTMGLQIPEGASVLMVTIGQLTHPWLAALVGCAILAAVISTATSLINAISSNLSSDFFFDRLSLKTLRILTGGLSLGAIFFAFQCNNIVDILIQSYELSVSCLFIPIFIALFKKQGHFLAALLSIGFGMGSFCLFKWVTPPFPPEIGSLLFSLVGYTLGELISRYRLVPTPPESI